MKRNETKTGGECPECDSKKTRTYATRDTNDPTKVRRHRKCQECGHNWYRIEPRQKRKRSRRQTQGRVSPTIARWCQQILEYGQVLEGM